MNLCREVVSFVEDEGLNSVGNDADGETNKDIESGENENGNTQRNAEELSSLILGDVRLTYIDPDGQVIYDSQADADEMENHNSREEVARARATDEAVVQRYSETIGTDTLYAAKLADNGCVVRLANTRCTLAYYLGAMWPQLCFLLVVMLLVAALSSKLITRALCAPLNKIDIAKPLDNNAYTELQPLLLRVDEQRKTLKEQNEELQQSVELRREFTGNVSHEMKTPLQVIGGYAELIESGVATGGDVLKFAGLIRSEASKMQLLIDDVLTLSRLDESAAAFDDVNLDAICEIVCDRLRSKAQARGIDIKFSGMSSARTRVCGNANTVEQMIYNLVDNAIKYSDEGGSVVVGISLVGGGIAETREDDNDSGCGDYDGGYESGFEGNLGSDSKNKVVVSVADTGCGIPDEAKLRVFERFYRVDTSRSRETGGTGLGLAIVKHAAEQMGGRVSVTDNKPRGTIFRVELSEYEAM